MTVSSVNKKKSTVVFPLCKIIMIPFFLTSLVDTTTATANTNTDSNTNNVDTGANIGGESSNSAGSSMTGMRIFVGVYVCV